MTRSEARSAADIYRIRRRKPRSGCATVGLVSFGSEHLEPSTLAEASI
jgi:hypothetical protein